MKTKNNIYKLFDCNSKEELYSLVKEKNERVQHLLNYMDFAKGDLANRNQPINSPEALGRYINSIELPKGKKASLLFINTKNYPLLLEKVDLNKKSTLIDAIKKGLLAGANKTFLATDSLESLGKEIEEFEDMLKVLGLNLLDVMHYNDIDKSLYSRVKGGKLYNLGKQNIVSYASEHNPIDYSEKEEYINFANYYTKRKIVNLNMVEDIDKIKETMKIGYQHNKQEIFGYIGYDQNNKVIKARDISIGGLNVSIVDVRIVLRELLVIENLKGVAFYHNHPSGIPEPSQEDLNITKRLINGLENFNIEYCDHLIIGKQKVFSFADKVFGFESKNLEYQDLSLTREKPEIYNLKTPVRKIPFTKQQNDFYAKLTDVDLMKLYLKERKESDFINPHTFETMQNRNLVFKGDKIEDIEKRLNEMIKIKKGDIIKTALSDNTIVLKAQGEDALLFSGSQFVMAHGIQREDEYAFWGHGDYYNELDDVYIEAEEEQELEDEWDMEI